MTNNLTHLNAANVARAAAEAAWDAHSHMDFDPPYSVALSFIQQVWYEEAEEFPSDAHIGNTIYADLYFDAADKHHMYAEVVYAKHYANLRKRTEVAA